MELEQDKNKNSSNAIQNNINKDESEINLAKAHRNNAKRRITLFNSSILKMKSPEKENPKSKIINNQLENMDHSSSNKENDNNISMNKSKEIKKNSSEKNNSKRHIKISLSNMKNRESKDYLRIKISLCQKNIKIKSQSVNDNIKFLEKLKITNDNLFIKDFSSFLEKNGIEIDPYNKLPKFTNKDNEYLKSEYEFWMKYINYISKEYKNSLTIYSFAIFIEQFYRYIEKSKNNNINYENFNKEIINNINQLFDSNIIDIFLQQHEIKNINELFEKYKLKYIPNYKEIKINEDPENLICKKEMNFNIISNSSNNKNHEILQKKLSESKNNIISMNNDNMNMKNKNNMNNNMDNNINSNLPIKIIKHYSSNYENSYANAVLQAFSSLDCISNWINELNNSRNQMQNTQESITKELYILLSNLYSGNQVDSTNLISTLQKKVREIYKKDMKKDEYHFLYYLLNMLHLENNCPNNPKFDINSYRNLTIGNIKNDYYMYNSFCNFFQQTTNSIISQYFFNIEKYFTSCSKCCQIFYYDHKVIITFELDKLLSFRKQKYPNKIDSNINLVECFNYYQNQKYCLCPKCKEPMSIEKTTLFSSTKVLILRFKRSSHNLKCDVDFDIEFNINDIVNNNNKVEKLKNNYFLKSVISLNKSINSYNYFSDVCTNDNWYRFCHNNDYVKNIKNNELKENEPQILIYELKEGNNYFNPFYNSLMNQNNNNNNSMKELINNQIKMLQSNNFKQRVYNNALFNGVNVETRIQNNNNNFNNNNNLN